VVHRPSAAVKTSGWPTPGPSRCEHRPEERAAAGDLAERLAFEDGPRRAVPLGEAAIVGLAEVVRVVVGLLATTTRPNAL